MIPIFLLFWVKGQYCGKFNRGLMADIGDTNEILGTYEYHA